MIDELIAYIEDKGFTVGVMEGFLIIQKDANGMRHSKNWAISQVELKQAIPSVLYADADHQMRLIDDIIAQES